jgi:hypothetical protein
MKNVYLKSKDVNCLFKDVTWFSKDVTCSFKDDICLSQDVIQVIALHINLKKNRKHQAVSIYKYFPSTCNFILSNAKLFDFKESKFDTTCIL